MLITNFSNGEISRNLSGRVDLQSYFQSASYLKNFDIIPTGGIKRRPGTKRLGLLTGNARIIPFILDKDNSFIFEMVEKKAYVWKNGARVTDAAGSYYYFETPFKLSEATEVQYAQNYDIMIMVHPNYGPLQITYSKSNKNFTAEQMDFDFNPDVNLDDDYDFIVIAGDEKPAVMKIGNKLICNRKTYNEDELYCIYNSKLWKYDASTAVDDWVLQDDDDPDIDYGLFNKSDSGTYPGTNKRPSAVTFFNGRLFFASSINQRQKVWASSAPDTKGNRYTNFATYEKYITVNKVVKDADLHVFTCNILTSQIGTGQTVLTDVSQDLTDALAKDFTKYNYYITNSNIPIGTKVTAITANTITIDRALTITEDITAATCTIQLWKNSNTATSDDYTYEVVSNNITASSDSFNFELASEENDCIKWMASNKYLTIGTESNVWVCPSSITATSIQAENNGRYGSDDLQALVIDTAVVFFAQGKKAIREHYYNSEETAFQTNNIAIMADQMLRESPAVDFDYMNNPYNRLVIVREDGTVVQMLYDKNNGVMGWHRNVHGKGMYKSCAVTRGSDECDLIYFVVQEKISDTESHYYLEVMDLTSEVYLDSWESWMPLKKLDDYNLNPVLYNKTTKEICTTPDDVPKGFYNFGDEVYVGYQYESDMISMPVVQNDPNAKKRIVNLIVRFLDSYMPVMKVTDLADEKFLTVNTPYSGVKEITYPGISDRDVTFEFSYNECENCTILAVNALIS